MTVTNNGVRGEQCLAANDVVTLFKDKWSILILGTLRRGGRVRYNELQRRIVGISQRMLTLRLKTLEENGLVTRTVFASVPPRVDYELSPLGHSLGEPLRGLLHWSLAHRDEMAAARRAYATASTGTVAKVGSTDLRR
ncbi:MAG: helix-turn-helix domain-containing protein [Kofleriaceae bacterium]